MGDVVMTKQEKARLDVDGTAEPKTRIVHHPNREHCLGPGTKLSKPEYEDESGKRTPLSDECTSPETCKVCHVCQKPQPCSEHWRKAKGIQLFDRVRSFDFADGEYGRDLTGPRANYIEGKVVGFADFEDCKRYAIHVKLRIVGGNQVDTRSDEFVYPPVNGTLTTLGRRTNSVEVIG